MTRAGRLSRHDHRTLLGSGSRASSGPVTVYRYPIGRWSLAFAVGRGTGGAVLRNRIRRRLAAAAHGLTWDGALVISGRPAAATVPFAELREHLERAVARTSR